MSSTAYKVLEELCNGMDRITYKWATERNKSEPEVAEAYQDCINDVIESMVRAKEVTKPRWWHI